MSPRRIFLIVAFLLGAVAFYGGRPIAVSGDEWQPISQEELKMTSEPKAPGAPAIILYKQVDRNDDSRATTEYDYVRIKILTEEGRKYANVEIPYVARRVNISGLRARTIRPDGSVVSFEGKAFDKEVAKTKGRKVRVRAFSLPDVQVGNIIEYHFNYDFEDNYAFSSLWLLSEELFTKRAKFSLIPYSRFSVRWQWPAGLPPGTVPPKQDANHVVRMTAEDIPAFQLEDYMPPENELKFRVNFIYQPEGIIEDNPDKYWKQVGKKENGKAEGFIGKQKAMQEAVGGIIAPGDSQEEKLRKIYARVQKVNNLTYGVARTEQEEKRDKIKAAGNVEDVWKSGTGDAWEINWLFLGLARAAGFEATPFLVSRRDESIFAKVRMNRSELSENAVIVKLDGKDRYFSPGTPFAPFGFLPWSETGVMGLKLDKDGGSFVQTDIPDSNSSKLQRLAEFHVTEEGSLEGKVTLKYTGLEALYRRLEQRNEDEAGHEKYLEEQLKECVPAAAEVSLKNKPEWQGVDTPLAAEFEVKIPGWVSGAGRRALLPVGIFSGNEKHVFEHASRDHDIIFHYPYQEVDDIKIELPLGWQVNSTPKPQDQDLKAVEYVLKAEGDKGTLHVIRTVRNDLVVLPLDKYPVLRSFFQIVRAGDEQQIVLQPGSSAATK